MGVSQQIRQVLVESPTSFGAKARARRWEVFSELFPDIESMSVIDLGGTVDAWHRAPVHPKHVTVLNLFEPGISQSEDVVAVTGDACDAVSVLQEQTGTSQFDLVFSNAVLEHVGGHANRVRFAASVRDLGRRHWIQTPYRFFPLEPHWLFPGMQFLPVVARARVASTWPLAHSPAHTMGEAMESVQWTELVGVAEMRWYFPDSHIRHERALGLTKSLIAVQA